MSSTPILARLRPQAAALWQKALAALTAPYSSRQMPALTRRTRHSPVTSTLRRDR